MSLFGVITIELVLGLSIDTIVVVGAAAAGSIKLDTELLRDTLCDIVFCKSGVGETDRDTFVDESVLDVCLDKIPEVDATTGILDNISFCSSSSFFFMRQLWQSHIPAGISP